MRSALAAAAQRRAGRARSTSLSAIPPPEDSDEYSPHLAAFAASILYRSPLPSQSGRPVFILNAAAFPDAFEVDYDSLLSYVLARLPGEDELISGTEYEIVFFAGGPLDNATAEKKQGPTTGWYLQAYHVLSRAMRKKLQMLYIVHPRTWVRVLISIFGTIVSPKFRRKIVHVTSLSSLALYIPIERLLIPPSAYMQDRKVSPDIYAPYVTGRRAFGAKHPLPKNISTGETRLPRVLRETTSFVLLPQNVRTEGLFRIPPNSVLAGVLKEAYDRTQQFIIWKEGDAVLKPSSLDQSLMDETRTEDTYGVHLAASLIKNWYRDLRDPIFPESSYAQLQERYGDAQKTITPEDLVDIILPASPTSPLTPTARQILIRHLLPLLSTVASHSAENKMNADNLAILFSMCLIRGSNQLEDGKISSIIRRILIEAIKAWPQLRTGLGISDTSFNSDLLPPADSRIYEDSLDDERPKRLSEDDTVENRITMKDSSDDAVTTEDRTPALPPRRSRAASLKAALSPSNVIEALPSLPKRKPNASLTDPTSAAERTNVEHPPRYSTVFDADGHSIHMAESPITITPADGFAPIRQTNYAFDENEKRGEMLPPESAVPQSIAEMPKRKAVSSASKDGNVSANAESESIGPNSLFAQMAAHQIPRPSSQRTISPGNELGSTLSSALSSANGRLPEKAPAGDVSILRKSSGTTSATTMTRQPSGIHTLAKPVVPGNRAQTMPMIHHQQPTGLSAPSGPRPRTPSPGLLKRMTSMENARLQHESSSPVPSTRPTTLEPKKLNLRKTSVDDLRRLYEDRANTAKNLVAATTLTDDAAAPHSA